MHSRALAGLAWLAMAWFASQAAAVSISTYNVRWTSPTMEPGRDENGAATYQGGMPLGNGKVTVLAWPNVTEGGIGLYIGRQDSMSDSTELFRLGLLQLSVTPNPFATGTFFNQTLDLSTATMLVYAGGSSAAAYNALFSIYVDANSDVVMVSMTSGNQVSYSLTVNSQSTRPSGPGNWSYSVPFFCQPGFSKPDVIMDPLPSGFAPGSLIQYHRNREISEAGLGIVASTLAQQGLASITHTASDYWTALQFGYAVDGGLGPALTRTGPSTLTSSAPGTSFTVRVVTWSQQTATPQDWLTVLGLQVQAQNAIPDSTRRAQHEAWWASFWDRSHIAVNSSSFPDEVPKPQPTAPVVTADGRQTPSSERYATQDPPVANPLLWYKADWFVGQPDGNSVAWWDSATGDESLRIEQPVIEEMPVYFIQKWVGYNPSVYFDGDHKFLQGNASNGIPAEKTIFAVFMDEGSIGGDNTPCCSGVFYSRGTDGEGSSNGLGTVLASNVYDDDPAAPGQNATSIMIDYSGSGEVGRTNVNGRPVIGVATYGAGSTTVHLDGCMDFSDQVAHGAAASLFMLGSRNDAYNRYFKGYMTEVIVYDRVLNDTERMSVEAYLAARWNIPPSKCHAPPTPAWAISQQYAITRYVQAVQSRGHLWPIKFNGMAFVAVMGDKSDIARQWGPSNWWQNTRLPYGAMLPAGDTDIYRVILDYYNNMMPFLSNRTLQYFNHSGWFATETKTIFGAFSPGDYDNNCQGRPAGYPVWLENNDYIHLDYGGDGGVPEVALAVLDYYLFTGDEAALLQYLPIATGAADFFRQHYKNRTEAGQYVFWPVQVLETYWCSWDTSINGPDPNCCVNDLPTIAGLTSLLEKLLALPSKFSTPAQRQQWQSFYAALPPLPMDANGKTLLPADVISSGVHNSETPELYAVHPYRLATVGRSLSPAHPNGGMYIQPAITAFGSDGQASSNEGWNQGIMDAAYLGMTETAVSMVISRAQSPSAPGYRFQGFSSHMQDYMPSADHLANFMTALHAMLMQHGEDGYDGNGGTVALFPTWPCDWDVSFKLWTPLNTSIAVEYAGGQLQSLTVTPPSRASAVRWANCVSQ